MFEQKKPKTLLQVFEEELKRNHAVINRDGSPRYDAEKRLANMTNVLCELMKASGDEELQKRLKAMEESISDLYITGRDKK